jgi:hypothetical protein
MLTKNFDDIAQALQNARTVGVASHIRPDADALGSTIAFALWLKDCGKEVTAWNEEGSTSKFHYLPKNEIVTLPASTPQKFDIFVALDTSVKNRLGIVLDSIAPGTPLVNIDHHRGRAKRAGAGGSRSGCRCRRLGRGICSGWLDLLEKVVHRRRGGVAGAGCGRSRVGRQREQAFSRHQLAKHAVAADAHA